MTVANERAHLELLLESPDLPAERFHLRRFELREAISRPFEASVEFIDTEVDGLDLDAAAGADLDVVFFRDGYEVRRVHGMIALIDDRLDPEADHRVYRATLVPRLHRLSLIETQEIFMDLTVPELVEKKLTAVGLESDFEWRLMDSYPTEEFKVQYRESDLAFVSRLLEHYGISYFVHEKEGRDVVVFTDHVDGFPKLEGSFPFRGRGDKRDVFRLERSRAVIPGMYAVRDYNYRTPLLDLTAMQTIENGYAGGVIEQGTHHKTPEEGTRLARLRAEERAATSLVYAGESDLPALVPGGRITVEDHPRLGNVELLVIEVEHAVTQAVKGMATGSEPRRYSNVFRAIPAERPYRPRRVTPKPRIHGLVTGIVDPGLNGDPSFAQLDEQGRYTVQVLFDTAPPGARAASRPLRMVQPHAGEGFGVHFPLKPGAEVVIGFIDGDPDRPMIVGSVPNPITPSPVDRSSARVHRIRTQTGLLFDLVDGS